MRTTLELDDDVVDAARQLARQRGATIGRVVSDLALKALGQREGLRVRNGVRVFPAAPGRRKPTLALVNRLRDEE